MYTLENGKLALCSKNIHFPAIYTATPTQLSAEHHNLLLFKCVSLECIFITEMPSNSNTFDYFKYYAFPWPKRKKQDKNEISNDGKTCSRISQHNRRTKKSIKRRSKMCRPWLLPLLLLLVLFYICDRAIVHFTQHWFHSHSNCMCF